MNKLKEIIIKIIMPVMSKLTPTCEMITQKISESMDHKISFIDRIKIRIHLLGCKFCQRFEKQLLTMRKIIENQANNLDELSTGPKLSDEAKNKMKLKLQQDNNRNN